MNREAVALEQLPILKQEALRELTELRTRCVASGKDQRGPWLSVYYDFLGCAEENYDFIQRIQAWGTPVSDVLKATYKRVKIVGGKTMECTLAAPLHGKDYSTIGTGLYADGDRIMTRQGLLRDFMPFDRTQLWVNWTFVNLSKGNRGFVMSLGRLSQTQIVDKFIRAVKIAR